MRTQYAKSTDPEVLAIAERNSEGRRDWIQRAQDWATEHGASNGGFRYSSFVGHYSITSLVFDFDQRPPKGWVQPKNNRGGWRPRRGTELCREMEAITFTSEQVPGLPEMFHAPRGDDPGAHWMMWPQPFVWDSAAWVMMAHMPTEGDFGPQWAEVLASQAYAAREALQASNKKETVES